MHCAAVCPGGRWAGSLQWLMLLTQNALPAGSDGRLRKSRYSCSTKASLSSTGFVGGSIASSLIVTNAVDGPEKLALLVRFESVSVNVSGPSTYESCVVKSLNVLSAPSPAAKLIRPNALVKSQRDDASVFPGVGAHRTITAGSLWSLVAKSTLMGCVSVPRRCTVIVATPPSAILNVGALNLM